MSKSKNTGFKILSAILSFVFIVASFAACGSMAKNEVSYESSSSMSSGYASDNYFSDYDKAEAEITDDYVEMPSDSGNAEVYEQVERQIIKTASITLETQSFDETVANVKAKVNEFGGYISSSSVRGSKTDGTRYANLTCRVPADNYEEFLNGAGELGNVTYLNENEEDVTNEYIDLDARIKNLEAQLDKLNELLKKAETLDEMLTIENYIYDIQYQLDSFKGRMKALTNRISYCTVNINVNEVAVYTAPKNSFLSRLGSAFSGMWENFLEFMQDALIFIIYAVPYIILGVGIFFIVKFIKKKRKAKKALQSENKASENNQEQNL